MLWQLFIFMELEPFFYYFVIIKTLDLSQEKYNQVQLDQYSPTKISKSLWNYDVDTLQDEIIILWQFLYFLELDAFFDYRVFTKTLNLSKYEKYISIPPPIFTQKISKDLWENYIHILQDMINILQMFLIFMDLEILFSTIFRSPRH